MARWEAARLVLFVVVSVVKATDPSSSPRLWSTAASFVPPASPTLTSKSPASTFSLWKPPPPLVTPPPTTTSTVLWSKRKAPSAKKVQVKLLKHVAGTGQAGDVVQVTPAFFQNKLRPQKSAVVITDDEVQQAQTKLKAQEEARDQAATSLKEKLSDFTLHITRKAGPDGQLFGGVSPKVIMEELKKQIQDDYLNEKQVKVASVTQDGKKMRGDIKHVGEFGTTLSLTREISAKFSISVEAEG